MAAQADGAGSQRERLPIDESVSQSRSHAYPNSPRRESARLDLSTCQNRDCRKRAMRRMQAESLAAWCAGRHSR